MKARESGMPEEAYWESFFDAEATIATFFGAGGDTGHLVEFGCGYGTFTVPAARFTRGVVSALDIEPLMVARVRQKAANQALPNVRAEVRDFVSQGTGLARGTQAHALIFNLLHLEQPAILLQEAHRVLGEGRTLAVMHWRSDIPTPRGPSLAIRPRPEDCRVWLEEADFVNVASVDLAHCAPYHFGLIARR